MSDFENQHPRARDGKFTDKPGTGTASESTIDLTPHTMDDDVQTVCEWLDIEGDEELEMEFGEVGGSGPDACRQYQAVADALAEEGYVDLRFRPDITVDGEWRGYMAVTSSGVQDVELSKRIMWNDMPRDEVPAGRERVEAIITRVRELDAELGATYDRLNQADTQPAPAPIGPSGALSLRDRQTLAGMRGALARGITPDDVNELDAALDANIMCVWDGWDSGRRKFYGDPELYVAEAAGNRQYPVSNDALAYLYEGTGEAPASLSAPGSSPLNRFPSVYLDANAAWKDSH